MTKSRPKTERCLLAALLFCLLPSCKKAIDIRHNQAYIVGTTSDIKPLDKAVEAQIDPDVLHGSVLIATHLASKRVKFCSGTLVAPENGSEPYRVLSNHHCFAQTDAEDKALPTLVPEACTSTTAYFGFIKGQTAQAATVGCKPGSLRTNFDGDLSVFTLAQNPPAPYRPLGLWDGDEAAEGREALIVHYPDVESEMAAPPDGGANLPTAEATLNDCKVLGLFAIGEWDLDRTLPYSLRHTCDLIHGSSGSGLIDVKTGKLLGVNWGGIKIAVDGGVRTDNVATRAKFAQAFLNNQVDDEIKAAGERRASSDALAVRQGEGGAIKSKSQSVADSVKSKCGVAGGGGVKGLLILLAFALAGPVALATGADATGAARPRKGPSTKAQTKSSSAKSLVATAGAANAAASTAPAAAAPSKALATAVAGTAPPTASTAPAPAFTLTGPPPNAASAWAVSYLLDAIFLAELDAAGASATPGEREKLRQRAAFASAAAKAKAQTLPRAAALSSELTGVAAPDAAQLAPGFGAHAPHWQRLASFYGPAAPTCRLDADDVKNFAEHQNDLLTGDRGANPQALLAPLAAYDLAQMQCLAFALTAPGFDPLPLLTSLQQTNSPLMADDGLRALLTLQLVERNHYAEALRVLVDLSDSEPAFRLAYELVQRIFSARQKGEGAVALQGL